MSVPCTNISTLYAVQVMYKIIVTLKIYNRIDEHTQAQIDSLHDIVLTQSTMDGDVPARDQGSSYSLML